jgi:glycosyltransferase involved in cell wall biosynthesis
MRIVNVCRVVHTQRAGGMIFCQQDRCEELARQGHEVHILTTSYKGQGMKSLLNGVTIHHLNCPTQFYSAQFASECEKTCRDLQPDVIHLDSFDRDRVWWKDRPGNPKVVAVTMHGNSVGTALTKWNLFREGIRHNVRSIEFRDMDLERIGLKNADRVIAISLNEEWQLLDVLGLSQVVHVANPIAPYFFTDPKSPVPEDGSFLCAAISGHGERGFLVAQETAERLGRKLKIVKGVPRREMPKFYDECAAVLLPTMYAQGYDLCVAEANARGRLVYATLTGSYYHEVEDNEMLIPVRQRTPESFIEALEGTPPEGRIGIAGFKWYVDRHLPANHVDDWLRALNL